MTSFETVPACIASIIAAEMDGQTKAYELASRKTLIRRVHQVTGIRLDVTTADKTL
ncbi:hypothetical protein GCM10022268_36790 [Sphingomonas cynarae]|uniref:Uncharacterized protein n=1 Tax=Sphingomonas cynarae TaxID=930197 RepID=A0ABP7EWB3_9SPHN